MDVPKAPGVRKTLLIVEDDILPAMALRDELEEAGYNVLDLTGHYQEALEAAGRSAPDLALVNIHLQGRDDGIALARRFKAIGIPVLFISGQVSRKLSSETAAIGSLPKPYSTLDMVKAVNYLLGRMNGDTSLSPPAALEVFDRSGEGTLVSPTGHL
jgi:DNA-binding response OmpR family regulator